MSSHGHYAVNFPSQDTGIATVKIFNRSARPASLSLTNGTGGKESGNETETEGEGSGTGEAALEALEASGAL